MVAAGFSHQRLGVALLRGWNRVRHLLDGGLDGGGLGGGERGGHDREREGGRVDECGRALRMTADLGNPPLDVVDLAQLVVDRAQLGGQRLFVLLPVAMGRTDDSVERRV